MKNFKKELFVALILISLIFPNLSVSDEVKLQRGVPYGILNRVFQIDFGGKNGKGTCFVIDVDRRQYIITAKHLVPKIKPTNTVKILINDNWNSLKVRLIFPKNEQTDIIALAASQIIAPKMEIFVGDGDITLGQDVYFLGFPYDLSTETKGTFPMKIAFIKKGILSAIDNRKETGHRLYIDGHNNHGFSGGPVIFANFYKKDRLQIASVITGYRHQPIQVYEVEVKDEESKTGKEEHKIISYVKENTGIIISYSIGEILESINKNPIGPMIPNEK